MDNYVYTLLVQRIYEMVKGGDNMGLFNKYTKRRTKTKFPKLVIVDSKESQTKSRILGKTKEIELSNIGMRIEDDD